MFLDATSNDKRFDSQLFIDKRQKVSLEGRFDDWFQLFVPEEYTILALSILSPDVMAKLIDSAANYDIDINGDRMRIITGKGIKRNRAEQERLLKVAEIVCREIQHRITSWNEDDVREGIKLDVIENGIVKIKRTYLPSMVFTLSGFLLLVAIPLFVLGVLKFINSDSESGFIAVLAGFFFYPGCYFIIRLLARSNPL